MRSLENSLTYLLSHKDFSSIKSQREKARMLTSKVVSITRDYRELHSAMEVLKLSL